MDRDMDFLDILAVVLFIVIILLLLGIGRVALHLVDVKPLKRFVALHLVYVKLLKRFVALHSAH